MDERMPEFQGIFNRKFEATNLCNMDKIKNG